MKDRYIRQTVLPEIGEEGQLKLHNAKVLIVGVGGLGSPTALYLTAAGIGTLGLVDDDVVSISNLQRQVLYTEAEVDQRKVGCAARRLKALNSEVTIHEYPFRLTRENAGELVGGYDLVIDGCDNFATRYLLNDACLAAGKPYVYGAIKGFEGQVSVFGAGAVPRSYRDLFPEDMVVQPVDIRDKGVLGTTPAVVGSMLATQAIALIVGFGEPLIGKLWTMDLRTMQTATIEY
ncbi:MAG: HesA/MoeB/ThiF family protein [Bacteroidales bacterium]|jgi:adenylyltransferase/sulfurtransferase|nr:HesA/MoeB/ThiF family protein [Bacteroidales bacterium]